jgi:phage terminase large subunit
LIVQFVSQEIRVLDYIELKGQKVGDVLAELRHRGWEKAVCHLPHDGSSANNVTGKTYEDHIREAGFRTTVTRNSGTGAARRRIEAVRRLFPRMWFNLSTTEGGRLALGYYHARRDEARSIDLGAEHDWSSDTADAFGLMAISYEEPSSSKAFNRDIVYPKGLSPY